MPSEGDWLSTFAENLLALSGWEALAAALGIAYVVLAARESLWCWPAAFVSTLIYTLLFWEGQLPMQALLNVYYMGMAVYGFLAWRPRAGGGGALHITHWPLRRHLLVLGLGTALTLAAGTYLTFQTEARLPYLDAAVTVFSVINTWLMARKVLENWLYWLVIDSAAISLYYQTGYYFTIVMFTLYLVLAVYGYINWRKLYRQQAGVPAPVV